MHGDVNRFLNVNDNGFLGNFNSPGIQPLPKDDSLSFSTASEPSMFLDQKLEGSKNSMGSVSALKELVRSSELKYYYLLK